MEAIIKRKPKASIIIITRNQRGFLEKSLPVIFNQTFKDFEVIAVDSGSIDGALELMQKYPIRIIHYRGPVGAKFNYAKAFNLGAKKAKGEFLVRLSGDVVPKGKNWLKNLIKPFSDSKITGVYGKEITGPDANFLHKIRNFFTSSSFQGIFYKLSLGILFYGACCALRKDFWKKAPFDELLPMGGDANWGLEMKKRGYKTFFSPEALFYHSHPGREIFNSGFWRSIRGLSVIYWRALVFAFSAKTVSSCK